MQLILVIRFSFLGLQANYRSNWIRKVLSNIVDPFTLNVCARLLLGAAYPNQVAIVPVQVDTTNRSPAFLAYHPTEKQVFRKRLFRDPLAS